MFRYITLPALVVTLAATFIPAQVVAQTVPDLLIAPRAPAAPRRNGPARRLRKAGINLGALDAATVRLQLFDDVELTVSRSRAYRPASDKLVWIGHGPDGSQAVLSVVRGVLTGTVFFDNRTFEVTIDPDGEYTVAELDPAAFPPDDPIDRAQLQILDAPVDGAADPPIANAAASGAVQVDAMIVWTPNAEAAAGGRAAMESLALASVANANLVYANSGISAQLNLVYAAPVSFKETPTSISTDLSALRGTSDGFMDQVHTLRTQYGADVVTLIGEGYRASACGIAYLMSTVSTSFASNAFNVVDRTCAVGNLSYAHENGHNQGLNHDAANASGTAAYSYALGYQSPSGLFRTVMSYGSAVRIPFLSSPTVFYSGQPTGTSNENNARALTNTISTVAAFKATTSAPAPPTCTYAVSTTSITFPAAGGSQSVSVTAPSGCSWQAAGDASASWVSLSTSGGSGSGTVTVSAAANTGAARSATVTIAGQAVAVGEAAAVTPPAGGGVNVAAASAGATASASTTYPGYGPAGAINGDRRGASWGAGAGWNDATPGSFPDWLQVDFAGPRTISEVRLFSVQDNYSNPVEPTTTQTFSLYGLTSFTVQYWDGAQWLTVPGGTITGNQHVWRTVTFPAISTSRIRIVTTGASDSYSRLVEVEAYEATAAPVVPSGGNVAAASAGATASASTTYPGYGPAGAINGDRRGANWGAGAGWNDASADSYPDWLQINFAGAKTISEVRIFTVQDNYTAPVEPTPTQTFSSYGVTGFTVQYWDGAQWVTPPGGTTIGNRNVWRTVTFPAVTTAHIRVLVTDALSGYSRLTEVEAYESGAAPAPAPAPAGSVNVAAASAGANVSASTTYSSAFSPAGAINGDRKGSNWGAGGGWNDASASSYPDWLQIDFAGAKTISEVRIFTVQDNYTAPVEPTPTQTFSSYGVTGFTVQYWDGAQWVTPPGGTIIGNRNVWRTVTFPAVTTAHIRVLVTDALGAYSRLTEVEAY